VIVDRSSSEVKIKKIPPSFTIGLKNESILGRQ